MKPAPFTYHRPASLAEALTLLLRHGPAAKPLAGGQSLGPMLNMRLARPAHLVDLNDLIELDSLRVTEDTLEVGALTRHHRLANAPEVQRSLPLLGAAAASIGHYTIRQRGTIGGSLAHADPAAQLPLIAVTLGATLVISGPDGSREIAAADFLQSIMTVDLRDGELITAVRFPLPVGDLWAYEAFSRRHGDFALVSVALSFSRDAEGKIVALRLGLGGVDTVPLRLPEIEARGQGRLADENTIRDLAIATATAIAPEDSEQVPAVYRRELAETLVVRAFKAAVNREEGA
ncbi:FAD binding domain-containing protein [Thioclava atlantica]|uniref:Putative carbon monoxide dehydrogenase medium subunit n=1 Tax=Thioclava atlantica TaxID=1317124 RepID=A0A085U0N0_9RHOB|nr:xanthine dehydrogenase family protein subunit M [Thioclava atlantica]KFE36527.1 putative carbon monoxide dehydrogenase medium subunit [Thioclava atlantica]